jgi:pyrroline-5-carboxylate reductase
VKTIVFLGGGRITAALLAGLHVAKYRQPILVCDHNEQKLGQLKKLYGVSIERDLHRAVAQARLLIIAVQPSSVPELLREIGYLDHPLAAVSLAAGICLANLRAQVGPPVRWARAMPSPLCRSRQGLTALTFDRHFPGTARPEIRELFATVSLILEIPERQMDAFTVAYSPSHGYHALATLAAAAEKLGLDRPTAMTAAAHALADAIAVCRKEQVSLASRLREAATPGGTATAVMEAMDRHGYQRAVREGLAAGLKRARMNARQS